MDWWRAYHDMTTDPKLRVIARKAGCRVADVLAIWVCILERASQAQERGTLESWDNEDIACAMDMDEEVISSILEAMQGKCLDVTPCNAMKRHETPCNKQVTKVLNWNKRQPLREREDDNSTQRVRAYRARKAEQEKITEQNDFIDENLDCANDVTPCNAMKRHETPRLDKIREEERREEFKTPPYPPEGVGTEPETAAPEVTAKTPEPPPPKPKPKPTGNSLPELKAAIAAYSQNPELLEALEEFRLMRERIRAPMTGRALQGILRELDKLAGEDNALKLAIVEQSIRRSWRDVFPVKDGNQGRASPGRHPPEAENYANRDYGELTLL